VPADAKDAETVSKPADDSSESDGIFKQRREPRTMEGPVLRGVAALLMLWAVWMVTRPIIYRAFPDFDATRQGAPGFPIAIHIGTGALSSTNESDENWICTADIGYTADHVFTFALERQRTSRIPYANFRKAGDTVDVGMLVSEAREKIAMDCAEPAGITHSYDFR
jgi:hypothetical protein